MPELILRPAARVLAIDPDERVLMLRVMRPYNLPGAVWLTPGGGVERGESFEQAALRELDEETAISGVDLGPMIWTRSFFFTWPGQRYCNQERYYLVRLSRSGAHYDLDRASDLEGRVAYRWWTLDDLLDNTEPLLPSRLAHFLPPILKGILPEVPLDISE